MGIITDIAQYLPPITSMTGLILYSFFAYVLTFGISWLRVKLVNDNVEFGKTAKQQIIKKRKEKSEAAKQLLQAMNKNA